MVEDQNSVEQEVTPQDHEPEIAEHSTENSQDSNEIESKEEKNWRELRKKAETAERRAAEAEERIRMQEEMFKNFLSQQSRQVQQVQPEVDEFADIDPDDYPTWKLADRRIEKRAEEIAERKYRELEAQREKERFLERLKSRYPDFESVVNPEAIRLFEKQEPELAQTIAELKDPYKMGLQTYNFLKKLNFSGELEEQKNAKEVERNLEKNKKTLQSPQVFDKRPVAKAFDIAHMSSNEKDQIYKEMMRHASLSPGF